MSHLRHLNLQLQGKNHTVADMYEGVEAFQSKLNPLERDIHGRNLHFPHLCENFEKHDIREHPAMKESLAENFKERFESSPKLSCDIILFLRQHSLFRLMASGLQRPKHWWLLLMRQLFRWRSWRWQHLISKHSTRILGWLHFGSTWFLKLDSKTPKLLKCSYSQCSPPHTYVGHYFLQWMIWREKQKQTLLYTYWTVPQVCDNKLQAQHKRA